MLQVHSSPPGPGRAVNDCTPSAPIRLERSKSLGALQITWSSMKYRAVQPLRLPGVGARSAVLLFCLLDVNHYKKHCAAPPTPMVPKRLWHSWMHAQSQRSSNVRKCPSGPERSRAVPSRPEPSRAVPSGPERSRAVPSVPSRPEPSRACRPPGRFSESLCSSNTAQTPMMLCRGHVLMILARLVCSESFWAVAKVRSPHTGPEPGYPRHGCCRLDPTIASGG